MRTNILGAGVAALLIGLAGIPETAWAQQRGGIRGGTSYGGVTRSAGYGGLYGGLARAYGYGVSPYGSYSPYGYGLGYGYGYGGLYPAGYRGLYTPRIYGTTGAYPFNNDLPDEVQSNYPPQQKNDAGQVAPGGSGVSVQVRVPADAQVWFAGSKTKQTGAVREFLSPPLEQGSDYVYEIRAVWQGQNGPVDLTRRVTVKAGQRVVVDFSAPQ